MSYVENCYILMSKAFFLQVLCLSLISPLSYQNSSIFPKTPIFSCQKLDILSQLKPFYVFYSTWLAKNKIWQKLGLSFTKIGLLNEICAEKVSVDINFTTTNFLLKKFISGICNNYELSYTVIKVLRELVEQLDIVVFYLLGK